MQTKAGPPLDLFSDKILSPLLEAYLEFNQLKLLYRQGWLRRGLPAEKCESVAEHTFSMALLAWMLCTSHYTELDVHKVLCMVLIHELGEVYAGDLVPSDAVGAEEKQNRERAGVIQVVKKLASGESYLDVWEEFEAGETAEARFVRQLDRLEMGLQAGVYQRQGWLDGQEFFESARQVVSDPQLRQMLARIQEAAAGAGAQEHSK